MALRFQLSIFDIAKVDARSVISFELAKDSVCGFVVCWSYYSKAFVASGRFQCESDACVFCSNTLW